MYVPDDFGARVRNQKAHSISPQPQTNPH